MGSCHGLSVHEVITVYFLRYHYWLLNITRDSKTFRGSAPHTAEGLTAPPDPQLFTMTSGRTDLKSGATPCLKVINY